MINSIVTYGPPGVLWVAAIYTVRSIRRRPGNPGLRFYWVTVIVLATALTVLLPPVYLAVDRMLGVPNLARFLGNGLALVACWAAQRFLAHISGADRPVRGLMGHPGLALIGTLGLMGGLFAAAPVHHEAIDFVVRFGATPFVLEYRLVFLAYLGLTLANLARLTRRYAAIAEPPALRLGLRLTAAGGLVGLGYVAQEGAYAASRQLGLSYPLPNPVLISEMLIAVAATLVAVGSTMPAWGPRLGVPRLCRWAADYRSLWRLYPLWHALYAASPDIALLPVRSPLAEMLTLRDLGFRLYRRTIEIQDGRLVLRAHIVPQAAVLARDLCRQAGIPEAEVRAIVEAASLRAALAAKALGHVEQDRATSLAPLGGFDIASNVAALERVAYYFSRSRIVRTVAAQMTEDLLGEEAGSLRPAG